MSLTLCDTGISKLFCSRVDSDYLSFVDGIVIVQLHNSGCMEAVPDSKYTKGLDWVPVKLYRNRLWARFGPQVIAG